MASDDEQAGALPEILGHIKTQREALQKVVDGTHYLAGAAGGIVTHPETGEPVEDDRPKVRALTEMRHLAEMEVRLRRLVPVTVEVREGCIITGEELAGKVREILLDLGYGPKPPAVPEDGGE